MSINLQSSTPPGASAASLIPKTQSTNDEGMRRMMTQRQIQDLLKEIDPRESIDTDVENCLLHLADEFVQNVTQWACQLAKHRKSQTVDVKDVLLHLERSYNIRVPGFAADDITADRATRKPNVVDAHKQRLAILRKVMHNTADVSKK